MRKRIAVGVAVAALSLGVATPAFAAHAGQYRATSPGNGKCHDTGRSGGTMPEPSSQGLGTAADRSETIAPFSCP